MSEEELKAWKNANNCTDTRRYYANRINYLFATMGDGWTAIFEIDRGQYTPLIQAADQAHAESYCTMREPITVPVQRI